MTYSEFKAVKQQIVNEGNIWHDVLNSFAKLPGGRVSDDVLKSAEYRKAKNNFNTAFQKERQINEIGNKLFKKEIRKEYQERLMGK